MATQVETSHVMGFGEVMANLISLGWLPCEAHALVWESAVLDETFWGQVPASPEIKFRVSHRCDGAKHAYIIQLQWEESEESEES